MMKDKMSMFRFSCWYGFFLGVDWPLFADNFWAVIVDLNTNVSQFQITLEREHELQKVNLSNCIHWYCAQNSHFHLCFVDSNWHCPGASRETFKLNFSHHYDGIKLIPCGVDCGGIRTKDKATVMTNFPLIQVTLASAWGNRFKTCPFLCFMSTCFVAGSLCELILYCVHISVYI